MRHYLRVFAILMIIVGVPHVCRSADHGEFENEVKVEWLEEAGPDRNVRLLENFFYIDPSGKRWPAVAGSVVDGASIPWPLWSIWIGPPFIGDYRRASVVHDVACELKEEITPSSMIAHRMFYDACLRGGVEKIKAGVMYWAVRTFGPKWGDQEAGTVLTPEQFRELQEIDSWIESMGISEDSSPEDIRKLLEEPVAGR